MVEESLLNKIRKLLELGSSDRNSSAHEAEAAMSKVQELLAKHQLELADVQALGQETQEDEVGTLPGKRFSRLESRDQFVLAILGQFFHVTIIYEASMSRSAHGRWRDNFDTDNGRFRRRILFVGRKTHVLIAQYIFSYLTAEFDRQWETYRRETGKGASARLDFLRGLYRGMRQRLQSEKKTMYATASPQQRAGLVKVEKDEGIDQFVRERFPDLRHGRGGSQRGIADPDSYISGERAGARVNIRPAVSQSGQGPKALPGPKS
jgi:hypothetical protein